jgi:hypothetical protein
MRALHAAALAALLASCAPHAGGRFPLRDPLTVDTDTRPVSVPCHPDPSSKEPDHLTCAPREYFSPFKWDRIDNSAFGPLSRFLAVDVIGEAANANALDEVADSSWFENRIGARPMTVEEEARGACKPEDALPEEIADGAWTVDHGKDNGSTHGFRVDVPGKGKYLLKADEPLQPERASAASVIGAALYHAAGFNTSCEQIVYVRRAQLTLKPGLTVTNNDGIRHPFGEAELQLVLDQTAHDGQGRSRMQASKWLPGLPIGPFRYEGTRDDDPNDIIPHENRRELRGSRLFAAWLHHWDAREQNTMDLWLAVDAKHKGSSPGVVRHYILDTSDVFGQHIDPYTLGSRLGHSYVVDFRDIALDLVTFGLMERPWDREHVTPGREKFGLFNANLFVPETWKGLYPNPAFLRMTERDGAWMARIIARFSEADLRGIVAAGEFSDPSDADYLTQLLIERQHKILYRYLTRLSPLADVHAVGPQICAIDLARVRGVMPADRFRYDVVELGAGTRVPLPATAAADGSVCFTPRSIAPQDRPDGDPSRIVIVEVGNGTGAGPLEIHTYDLGDRGLRIVGLSRPAPSR